MFKLFACVIIPLTDVVTMDAFLQTTDTHMELCKALRMSHKPQCHFKLCLNKLDIMCLGLPRTAVLLDEIDPEVCNCCITINMFALLCECVCVCVCSSLKHSMLMISCHLNV